MKTIAFILAMYLVTLSVLPCCVWDDCPEDKSAIELAAHSAGDEDCGSCSPFFNCEGCASLPVVAQSITSFELPVLPAMRVYAFHIPATISDVHMEHWRPPQLV